MKLNGVVNMLKNMINASTLITKRIVANHVDSVEHHHIFHLKQVSYYYHYCNPH